MTFSHRQCRVIAVRHGETEWNLEKRVMGQLDSPLTALGVRQAQALAERLRPVPFRRLYSSDLGRAMSTAGCIAAASGRALDARSDLRERDKGVFQGLTRSEAGERYPEESHYFERLADDYPIPDGESGSDFRGRCVAAFTDLADQHMGEQIVVVTHGGVLRRMFEYVLGLSGKEDRTFKRQNASFNVFVRDDNEWAIETWGDTSHLVRM